VRASLPASRGGEPLLKFFGRVRAPTEIARNRRALTGKVKRKAFFQPARRTIPADRIDYRVRQFVTKSICEHSAAL